MNQFVVLRHAPGDRFDRDGEHFDWMFQRGDTLQTWATMPILSLTEEVCLEASPLPDHRIEYLEIEGDIGEGRGKVTQIARGTFECSARNDELYSATLTWSDSKLQTFRQTVKIYRIPATRVETNDEGRVSWQLQLGVG